MLWTDEKVQETVTPAYIYSHLRPNEQDILKRSLYFGGDLTDDTYIDWILTKGRRFFIILVTTGVAEQIFGVTDEVSPRLPRMGSMAQLRHCDLMYPLHNLKTRGLRPNSVLISTITLSSI